MARLPNFKNIKIPFKRIQFKKRYNNALLFLRKRPLTSFFIALVFLFLLILFGSFIGQPAPAPKQAPLVKSVQVYRIGRAPRISVQAKIQKSGVVKIVALTPGVIQAINVSEGQQVEKGTNLITIASNYQGENILAEQAAVAFDQAKNVNDTYNDQKDLIKKQKDLADANRNNSEQLRQITAQSIDQTNTVLNLDQTIVSTLNQNLSQYQATNSAGINNPTILQTQQLLSQFQSAVGQLQQASTSAQYQTNTDNPPTRIVNITHDIAIKQLDLQQKTLNLTKEVTNLQAGIAQANANMMHPVTPFSGVIEKVYVREGESLTPGSALFLLSADTKQVTAVANVPEQIARNISPLEQSDLVIGNKTVSENPTFISTEATNNQLYTVSFDIPSDFAQSVTDADYIQVTIPIGFPDTGSAIPFIPIDSIYQSAENSYVYVIKNGNAFAKTISLGQVYGRFAQVSSGLLSGDQVILDRNVVAGDAVSTKL